MNNLLFKNKHREIKKTSIKSEVQPLLHITIWTSKALKLIIVDIIINLNTIKILLKKTHKTYISLNQIEIQITINHSQINLIFQLPNNVKECKILGLNESLYQSGPEKIC